mgnify:CR=1 FL=1
MIKSCYWVQTYTGKSFDLSNPLPSMVCIEDIAHALATLNRYTGHARWPYSIAQHSIMVAEIVAATAPELGLPALLHDSPEAYTNDWSSPLKRMMRDADERDDPRESPGQIPLQVERSIEHAIRLKFRLFYNYPADALASARRLIKHADLIALATEKRDLFGPAPQAGWGDATGFALPPPLDEPCAEWPWQLAKTRFLQAFERYGGQA